MEASPAFDSWSLGVLCYLLFTGEHLFTVDNGDNLIGDGLKHLHSWNASNLADRLRDA